MDNTLSKVNSSLYLSTSFYEIDQEFVVRELQSSYWTIGRSKEMILKSIGNSLCYSVFHDGKQVGFMRVVTDYSTFAYLCDVVVTVKMRGLGIGKFMLDELIRNPELMHVKWVLRTRDAHGLYEKFGFSVTQRADRYMEKNN